MDTKIKKDFPLLASSNLIYFDNAATTHKPQAVIDAINSFYSFHYAPVHRAMYSLSEEATQRFENVRKQIAQFIHAQPEEIVFTQGTTHGINFIATAWGLTTLKHGDEIVLTELEHHANLIPWQQVAHKTGALLKFIPIKNDGTLDLTALDAIITERTKLVSIVHVSNALGTHNDIVTIAKRARTVGAYVMLDAAQSIAHQTIDVRSLDVDFLAFSGHKLLGPTGIGVLYIHKKMQPAVPPYQFGGGMIFHADYHHATWLKPPHCYEAGTPPIAQVIGLGAAVTYIQKTINFHELTKHTAQLCSAAIDGLQKIPTVTLLGPLDQLQRQGYIVSFTVDNYHPHDIGAYLNKYAIAVRSGHYCAQPLAQRLSIPNGSIRLSFYGYNSLNEVEYFISQLNKLF